MRHFRIFPQAFTPASKRKAFSIQPVFAFGYAGQASPVGLAWLRQA
jgi:hypothetical protein